eukprot:2866315-Alexandrium_andersonii.AAC.1
MAANLPLHSWDVPPPASWEEEEDDRPWDCDSDDDRQPSKAEAAEEFLSLMMAMLMASTPMAANHFCILCHWAHLAGMTGVGHMAHPPGKPSGRYSRVLKRKLDSESVQRGYYRLRLPGQNRFDLARTVHT